MKMNSKKTISLILVIAMALSILPAITLTTRAAEIERPQGISIVQNYDVYEKRLTEDGDPQWLESLGLPETVKVGGEEKAVTWADFKTYVDMSTPGYYALPGTVEGVEEQTYIVIQVREKINLLDVFDGDFETSHTSWYIEAAWANRILVQDPVQNGNSALKTIYTGTKTNLTLAFLQYTKDYVSQPTDLAALVTGGTYYYGVYGRLGSTASETDRWLGAKLQYSTDAATTVGSGTQVQYHVQKLSDESWKNSYLIVDLPADTAWVWPFITYGTDGGDANGDEIYLDNAELVNIDVLPLEEEPAAMTEVTGEALASISLAKDYDKYVADWQTALALPSEVTVAASDGSTGTANVIWDYSGLDLTKPGKYVLSGKLTSSVYLNVSDLAVEQTVLVNEASNLIFNGDFTDGSTGRTGWIGDWLCAKATHPADADRTVLNAYRSDAKRWYTQVLGQQTNTYKTDLAAKVQEGQYYFAIDIMSVDYDGSTVARDDLQAEINFIADGSELTTNVNTAVAVNEWTTISEVINTTGTYASVTTQLQVKTATNNVPASLYLTNFKLVLLKATLPAECSEHTYTDYVVAPTCTEAGYTEHICFVCGYSYTDTECEALGHTYTEQTDCTVAVECSVCREEIYAAKDHTYDNDQDADCNACGAIREVKPASPVLDTSLNIQKHTMQITSDLKLGFSVDVANVKDAADFYVVFYKADGITAQNVYTTVTKEAIIAGGISNNRYYAYYPKVLAGEMNDAIEAVLYVVDADGTVRCSETDTYSVVDYLTLLMTTYQSYPAYVNYMTVSVELLGYGAAAQENFGYKTETPANAIVFEKGWDKFALESDPTPVNNRNWGAANNSQKVVFKGSGLKLEESIYSNIRIDASKLTAEEFAALKMVIKAGDGTVVQTIESKDYSAHTTAGNYYVTITKILPKDMAKVYTLEMYVGETLVSTAATYSVESYVRLLQDSGLSAGAVALAALRYGTAAALLG